VPVLPEEPMLGFEIGNSSASSSILVKLPHPVCTELYRFCIKLAPEIDKFIKIRRLITAKLKVKYRDGVKLKLDFDLRKNISTFAYLTAKIKSRVAKKIYKTYFHSISRPSLNELYSVADLQTNNVDKLFLALGVNNFVKEKENEFNKVFLDYQKRLKQVKLVYPKNFSIDYEEAKILYMLTLYIKPQIFLETGVADGVSSFFILSALKKNNFGKLISVDIKNDVGAIVPESLKDNWNLKILEGDLRNSFKNLVLSIPKINIFLHDSDHSYGWQSFEYDTVFNKIDKNGLLISDDIDNSYAFIDFYRKLKNNYNYEMLNFVTERKVLGIIRRKTTQKK